MNQKRKHLTDATRDSTTAATSKRLADFESRLKATQPRSVQLDLESLHQRAEEDRCEFPGVELPTNRRPRPTIAMATSWLCGAAVGALVMFALMSYVNANNAATEQVAITNDKTSESVAGDSTDSDSLQPVHDVKGDLPRVDDTEQRNTATSAIAMAIDPLAPVGSTYTANGPTLQVGTHLRGTAVNSIWPFLATANVERTLVVDDDAKRTGTNATAPRTENADPPPSRRQLMQEFLEESA